MRLNDSEEKTRTAVLELKKAKEQNSALARKIELSSRPPRTAIDKRVAEVVYFKTLGPAKITLKPPGSDPQPVERAELNERLFALKKRYPDSLFIRVVLPADSLATARESWEFTRELLDKYDYYYSTGSK